MEISARSFLTAGLSLTAATSIAFAPLTIPESPHAVTMPDVTIPSVTVSDMRLTATSDEIAKAIAALQSVLDEASGTVADVAGLPGRGLIGVAGDIETFFDVALTGLIDDAATPAAAASLTILRTLAVDAWAKLEENLGLINPAITTATAQVGTLLTSAVTGSLQNILIAVANVARNPLSLRSYAGVLNAGLASGQLVIGNGLRAVQRVGDAGFDIAGIAVRELTFQFTNLIGGASTLLTQLGEASGIPAIGALLGAVRDLVLAPARAAINLGSGLIQAGLTAANAGFDLVLGGVTRAVDPRDEAPQPADTVISSESTVALRTTSVSTPVPVEVEDEAAPTEDDVPAVEETVEDAGEDTVVDTEKIEDAPVEETEETVHETTAGSSEITTESGADDSADTDAAADSAAVDNDAANEAAPSAA